MHQQGVTCGAQGEPGRGPLVPRLQRDDGVAAAHVACPDQTQLDLGEEQKASISALVEHAREPEQEALGLAAQVALSSASRFPG